MYLKTSNEHLKKRLLEELQVKLTKQNRYSFLQNKPYQLNLNLDTLHNGNHFNNNYLYIGFYKMCSIRGIYGCIAYKRTRHKSTLAIPGKMFVLSGSTCKCNLTKPYKPNKSQHHLPLPCREASLP